MPLSEDGYSRTPRVARTDTRDMWNVARRGMGPGRRPRLSQAVLDRRHTSHLAPRVASWGNSSDNLSTRSEKGEYESADEVEDVEEMALAREEAEHQEKMAWTRKHLASDPDGNLYRGWAVGIQKGWRPFLMTILVIIAQFTGPVVMLYWGHKTMAEGLPQPFYTYLESDASAGVVNGTHNHTVVHIGEYADKFYAIQIKILGTALMLILFFNGEQLLDRMDRQTDRLRYLYPTLKRRWMIVDAFFNSWCVAASAIAAPFLILTAEGAKDLVLDAFGLLFLATLDEYSASIEYGIETSDFDDLIDDREQELGEAAMGPSLASVREGTDEGLSYMEEDLLQSYKSSGFIDGNSWEHFWERFRHGDIFFSLARQVNLIAGCIAVPAYICTRWDPVDPQPGDAPLDPVYPLRDTFFQERVVIFAGVMVILAHIPYAIDFARQKNHDFIGFLFIVLFRGRGDPREADPDGDDDDL